MRQKYIWKCFGISQVVEEKVYWKKIWTDAHIAKKFGQDFRLFVFLFCFSSNSNELAGFLFICDTRRRLICYRCMSVKTHCANVHMRVFCLVNRMNEWLSTDAWMNDAAIFIFCLIFPVKNFGFHIIVNIIVLSIWL